MLANTAFADTAFADTACAAAGAGLSSFENASDCCWFTGAIDDVRVFDYALAEDEVQDLFENVTGPPPGATFRRGDVDGNGMLEVTDPIVNLSFQFLGGVVPLCLDAFDVDDNGSVELSDPVYSLSVQFAGGAPIPAPGATSCGQDPTTDALDCAAYPTESCGG